MVSCPTFTTHIARTGLIGFDLGSPPRCVAQCGGGLAVLTLAQPDQVKVH